MATKPPAGPPPDPYGGRGPEIIGVSWALMALTTVLLTLRILNRMRPEQKPGLPALLWAVGAWLLATMAVSFLTAAAHYGLGNHIDIVEEAGTIVPAIKWQWVADALISLAIGVGKFAVVAFYIDIQGPTHKWRQRGIIFLAVTNLANNIVLVFLIFFQCQPIAFLWDKAIPGGTCPIATANLNFGIAGGAWNAATDLVLSLYPIGIVYNLQMRKKLKFGLCLLMGLGLFTVICSIMKTYQFPDISKSIDPTYALSPLILWGVAEMWVILITASIPPLWPLVRRMAERTRTFSTERLISPLNSLRRSGKSYSHSNGSSNNGDFQHSLDGSSEHKDAVIHEQPDKILVQNEVAQVSEPGRGIAFHTTAEGGADSQ